MRDVLENINVYFQYGRAYCQNCFVKVAFDNKEEELREKIENDQFTDINGKSFNIWHDGTVDGENYAHEIIPWEGIKCDDCDQVCIEEDDSDMRKQRFIFDNEENRDKFVEYVHDSKFAVDDEVTTEDDTDERTAYEATFHTYTELDDREARYMIQTYKVSSYQLDEHVY